MKLDHQFKILASGLLVAWLMLGAVVTLPAGGLPWLPAVRALAQGPDSEIRMVEISRLTAANSAQALLVCPPPESFKKEELSREQEPNDSFGFALRYAGEFGGFRANLTPPGDQDWYRFKANAGSRVYAATSTVGSAACEKNTRLRLFSSSLALLEEDDNAGSIAGEVASGIAGAVLPAKDFYYWQVSPNGGGVVQPYHLYTSVVSAPPVLETEPNNDSNTAQPIPSNRGLSGTFTSGTDKDWFSIQGVPAGATVFLALDLDPERSGGAANGRVGLCCFPENGPLANNTDTDPTSPSEALLWTVKEAGNYFVYVDAPNAAANETYQLYTAIFPAVKANFKCSNFQSPDPPRTIPPSTTISSVMPLNFNKKIDDLNAYINIQNVNSPSNIALFLTKSDGTKVPLVAGVGDPSFKSMDTGFDDEAALTPLPLFHGTIYQPLVPNRLSAFDGKNAAGVWTLSIQNTQANGNGTLLNWSLELCKGKKPAAPDQVSPDDGATSSKARVKLDWDSTKRADWYKVIVKQNSQNGPVVDEQDQIANTKFKTDPLADGNYAWRAGGCNDFGCKWSTWRDFIVNASP